MADREQPYDPYIPSGGAQPAAATQNGGNQRTAALQAVSDPHRREWKNDIVVRQLRHISFDPLIVSLSQVASRVGCFYQVYNANSEGLVLSLGADWCWRLGDGHLRSIEFTSI